MLSELRDKINNLKQEKLILTRNLDQSNDTLKELGVKLEDSERALVIIQLVGQETQSSLEYRISELVNLALTAVFDDPYRLTPIFEVKRNQTECSLLFEKNGEPCNPEHASGGGAIDIAAFALRLTALTLIKPAPRNILILDEPFRFLSENLQPRAALMLKELSDRIGIQIIMVTHNQLFKAQADEVFQIEQDKGISSCQ